MMKYDDMEKWIMVLIITTFLILFGSLLLAFSIHDLDSKIQRLTNSQCNCTVNINGSIMSVEDGFYHLIEGLSADQVQEIQIMINNSLEAK
jgi:hypothetical protein